MSKEELHQSIEALRAEIEKLEPHGVEKERIDRLIQEVEHQAENPDDTAHKDSLVENVRSLTEQFELEHPRLISVLNRIMVSLGGAGI